MPNAIINLTRFKVTYSVHGYKLPVVVFAKDKKHAADLGVITMRKRLKQPTWSGLPVSIAQISAPVPMPA